MSGPGHLERARDHQLMLFPEVVPLDLRAWIDCADCGVLGDLYMVHHHVWPVAPDFGSLCVSCLEARIGRRLTRGDFNDAPCNDPAAAGPRLRSRLEADSPGLCD